MASILPPHHQIKDSSNRKVLPRCGRKKALSNLVNFSLSPFLVFEYALLVCFAFLFWVNLVLCFALFNMFLLVCFQFCFILLFIKKNQKSKKYKNSMCFVYIDTCAPWMAIETKFYKFCIFCTLEEHLYAQISKWSLWLVVVISKIKESLVLNTYITLFEG